MLPDPRETVGPPSEKTLENVRRATASGRKFKQVSLVWKWWTDYTRFMPEYTDEIVDWWERSEVFKVRWIKFYWLRFAISIYWPMEPDAHERMNHVQ